MLSGETTEMPRTAAVQHPLRDAEAWFKYYQRAARGLPAPVGVPRPLVNGGKMQWPVAVAVVLAPMGLWWEAVQEWHPGPRQWHWSQRDASPGSSWRRGASPLVLVGAATSGISAASARTEPRPHGR
jgi:hypothetical protein